MNSFSILAWICTDLVEIYSVSWSERKYFIFLHLSVLFPVLVALTYWLHQRYSLFVWTAGAAAIIFRFETVILLGLYVLGELLQGKFQRVLQMSLHAVAAGFFWLSEGSSYRIQIYDNPAIQIQHFHDHPNSYIFYLFRINSVVIKSLIHVCLSCS